MTKEVSYTVMVPQEREEKYSVTLYDCVPEEKTCTYEVCVPVQVTKEVPVKKVRHWYRSKYLVTAATTVAAAIAAIAAIAATVAATTVVTRVAAERAACVVAAAKVT